MHSSHGVVKIFRIGCERMQRDETALQIQTMYEFEDGVKVVSGSLTIDRQDITMLIKALEKFENNFTGPGEKSPVCVTYERKTDGEENEKQGQGQEPSQDDHQAEAQGGQTEDEDQRTEGDQQGPAEDESG